MKHEHVVDGTWSFHVAKTDTPQALPLPQMALDILEECPTITQYQFLAPVTTGGQNYLKTRLGERCEVTDWVYHDFRAAFMTHLGDLGAPTDIADLIQRPKTQQATVAGKHYDFSTRTCEKGRLLEYWAYVMRCYLEGREPKRWREYIRGADVLTLEVA